MSGDGEREDDNLDANDPMNPEAWYGEPNICGSCIAWRPIDALPAEDVATGQCRLRPELGRVPATLTKCSNYKRRGEFVFRAPDARRRREDRETAHVLRRSPEGDVIARTNERRVDAPTRDAPKTIELGDNESVPILRRALEELIRSELGRSRRELANKFKSGVVRARSRDGRKVEISAERMFSLLDRLRLALDALEKRVLASAPESERDELVSLVRRVHGSFTTFNVMFSDRDDYFEGQG